MYFVPYEKSLKDFSRYLRNNSTVGEVLLWKHSRAGGFYEHTFNRQKPLDRYIVDFYCKKLKLVIEIDGQSHNHDAVYIKDIERESILRNLGLQFLRFSEYDVRHNIPNVLFSIRSFIEEYHKENGIPL